MIGRWTVSDRSDGAPGATEGGTKDNQGGDGQLSYCIRKRLMAPKLIQDMVTEGARRRQQGTDSDCTTSDARVEVK